jgi:hypothetical protein
MNGFNCGCIEIQSSTETEKFVSTNPPLNLNFSAISRINCATAG